MLNSVSGNFVNKNNLGSKKSKLNSDLSVTPVASNQIKQISNFPKSYIAFGWCTPHIGVMKDLNAGFNKRIQQILSAQKLVKSTIDGKNLFKNTQYSLLDKASADASTLFSQFCNMQFSVSEMLPTYALSLDKSLLNAVAEMDAMNNPINTLISLNNVTKLNVKAGIDNHTGKEYTIEQVKKAKAGTQLYTTVMLVEKINQNMNNSVLTDVSKEKITGLTNMIHSTIDGIYGKNIYQRIKELSEIGEAPTLEQKKASIHLISEIDSKAQELILPKEFEKELQDLINYQNNIEGKTIENTGTGLKDDFALKLAYHTHAHPHPEVKVGEQGEKIINPEKIETHDDHHHHHSHGPMGEEEHRMFHAKELEQKQQEQTKLRNKGE